MSSRHILTIGAKSQLEGAFKGPYLKGWNQPRIAVVGRSNVGKSTLLNRILGAKLAQVSKEPGKTRALHFYLWEKGKRILVDLPGYGFAKTSEKERERWAEFINAYLQADPNLQNAMVLLDSRHGPTELDRDAIEFLSFKGIPVTFVLTKLDQLKTQSDRARRKREVAEALNEMGFDPKEAFWVSAKTGQGLKELERELLTERTTES